MMKKDYDGYIKGRRENYLINQMDRYLNRRSVMFLMKTGITPNMVTIFGLLVMIPLCFISTLYFPKFVTAILIQLVFFVDTIDGDLARNKNMCSKFGARLDYVTDMIFYIGFYVFLGVYYQIPLGIIAGFVVVQQIQGIIAKHYFAPHMRKIQNLKRPRLKQFFWDRTIIFGMDVSFLNLVMSVSLICNRLKAGYLIVISLWILDMLYRTYEIMINEKREKDEQIQ